MNAATIAKRREAVRHLCIRFLNTSPDNDLYPVVINDLHNATRRLLHCLEEHVS